MSDPRRGQKGTDRPLPALSDLVTDRRVLLRLTQQDLADLAGVGLSSVHSIEHGSDRVTLAVLLRVLAVLGVSLSAETRDGLERVRHVAIRRGPS